MLISGVTLQTSAPERNVRHPAASSAETAASVWPLFISDMPHQGHPPSPDSTPDGEEQAAPFGLNEIRPEASKPSLV